MLPGADGRGRGSGSWTRFVLTERSWQSTSRWELLRLMASVARQRERMSRVGHFKGLPLGGGKHLDDRGRLRPISTSANFDCGDWPKSNWPKSSILSETGGRWSDEAAVFLWQLARRRHSCSTGPHWLRNAGGAHDRDCVRSFVC